MSVAGRGLKTVCECLTGTAVRVTPPLFICRCASLRAGLRRQAQGQAVHTTVAEPRHRHKKTRHPDGRTSKKVQNNSSCPGFRNRHRIILIQISGYASEPAGMTAPVMPHVRTGCSISPEGRYEAKKTRQRRGNSLREVSRYYSDLRKIVKFIRRLVTDTDSSGRQSVGKVPGEEATRRHPHCQASCRQSSASGCVAVSPAVRMPCCCPPDCA